MAGERKKDMTEVAAAAYRKMLFAVLSAIDQRNPHFHEMLEAILQEKPAQPEGNYLAYWAYKFLDRAADAERFACWRGALPHASHMESVLKGKMHLGGISEPAFRLLALKEFLSFDEADLFIISYPKCGRTWLRFMLGLYLSGDSILDVNRHGDLRKITVGMAEVPVIEVSHDDYPQWKTPEEIEEDKSAYRDKSVILLVRDPRDVVVSRYMQFMFRGGKRAAYIPRPSNINEFAMSPYGIPGIIKFYNAWARNKHTARRMMVMKYENLRSSPSLQMETAVQFIGAGMDHERLQNAIDQCAFDRMKSIEAAMKNPTTMLGGDRNNPESYKVRKGAVGGYRKYLDESTVGYVDSAIRENLDPLFSCYFNQSESME